MRIEMLTIAAGSFSARPGDVLDLPTKQAKSLVQGGCAVEVKRGAASNQGGGDTTGADNASGEPAAKQ